MQFYATGASAARQRSACAIVGIHERAEMTGPARELDRASGGAISRVLRRGDFSGKAGEILPIMGNLRGPAERVLLVGLGTKKAYGRKAYRRAISAATHWIAKGGAGICEHSIFLSVPVSIRNRLGPVHWTSPATTLIVTPMMTVPNTYPRSA